LQKRETRIPVNNSFARDSGTLKIPNPCERCVG
jgi:hypothetical protein